MSYISKNAVVSPNAKIGENVTIKDFAVIEDDVIIKDNVEISYNVLVENGARISSNCKIYKGSVISSIPHDLKYAGEKTTLEIGENTVIREYSTISRGTKHREKTVIGKNCFFMAYVHVPHDSIIGDNVILSNAVNMGGHVIIDDWAIVGGLVGVHQFVRIGCHSFIAFSSRVTQDVPPYILAGGNPLNYKGLNLIGLKRRGFSEEVIKYIKQTYNYIYNSNYIISDAIKAVKESVPMNTEVKKIIEFIETSERGIIRK
ncbi:MAG: acyl-ACP--UDP-N-acetylglucosamine O-acyltransferase [Ignavibacteria bacterium]